MKGTPNIGGGDDENAEDDEDDPYAQEMAIFLAEINDCEGSSIGGGCSSNGGSTSKSTAGNAVIDDVIRTSSPAVEMEKFKVIYSFCASILP